MAQNTNLPKSIRQAQNEQLRKSISTKVCDRCLEHQLLGKYNTRVKFAEPHNICITCRKRKRSREHARANPKPCTYKATPEQQRKKDRRRKQQIKQATPIWSDKSTIYRFKESVSKLNKGKTTRWALDHVIPLINDRVCGLHVPNNLQIITSDQNRRKSNAFTPFSYCFLTGETTFYNE